MLEKSTSADLPKLLRPRPIVFSQASPELKYRSTFIAVVDILGYKELIRQNAAAAPERMFGAIRRSFGWAQNHYESIALTLFSDTIVVEGYDDHPINFWNMVRVIANLRQEMLKDGFLLRGGLSFGEHFSSGGIWISPAMVAAHELEVNIAVYPRIIISGEALRRGMDAMTERPNSSRYVRVENLAVRVDPRVIRTDFDGNTVISLDTDLVELHYLQYGEHPDQTNIEQHHNHCVALGNATLKILAQGIREARKGATTNRAISKIGYCVAQWNNHISAFSLRAHFSEPYTIDD